MRMIKKMSNDKDDMVGFKEFVGGNKKSKKRQPRDTSYENLTFLQQESDRLNCLIDLFEYKISNVRDYPQDIALSVQQETLNIDLRENLIDRMLEDDSPFRKKMALIFDSFFSK
jgi:hypothetical protein